MNFWKEEFIHFRDGDYYLGSKRTPNKRGFIIHPSGVWDTSFYTEAYEPNNATIKGKMCAYYFDGDNYFEATLNEKTNTVKGTVAADGETRSFELDCSTGNWTYTDDYLEESFRLDAEDCILYYDNGNGEEEVTDVRSGIFEFNGKIEVPLPIKKPSACMTYEDAKGEAIYASCYASFDGVMIRKEKGDVGQWWGECVGKKAGGFGIKYRYTDEYRFYTYGLFEEHYGTGIPYIRVPKVVQIDVSIAKESGEIRYEILSGDGLIRFEFLITKDKEIVLLHRTNDWNTIRIHERFNSVEIKYKNDPKRYTYDV